jgi:hypothetical protein
VNVKTVINNNPSINSLTSCWSGKQMTCISTQKMVDHLNLKMENVIIQKVKKLIDQLIKYGDINNEN